MSKYLDDRIKKLEQETGVKPEIWLLIQYGDQEPRERLTVHQPQKHEFWNPETREWQAEPYAWDDTPTVIEPNDDDDDDIDFTL